MYSRPSSIPDVASSRNAVRRSDQEDSGERQPLLFARRQNSSPISRLVEPTDQMCEMHLGERVVEPAVVEVRAPGVRLT